MSNDRYQMKPTERQMRIPHYASAVLALVLSLCLLPTVPPASAQAQQGEGTTNRDTASAIDSFHQGDAPKAINHLQAIVEKRPDDADAWCYLGLAQNSKGLTRNSLPAFEQCVRLRPNDADAHAKLAFALVFADQPRKAIANARRALELGNQSPEAHYAIAEASLRAGDNLKALEAAETALRINPNFSASLITRSLAYYHLKQYPEAAASLEQFLAANPDDMDAESWRGQMEELRALTYVESNPGFPILTNKEVTERVRVLSKPEPQYSEAARKAGVQGTVALRAVFSDQGEVKNIVVLRALGYGLTNRAIEAVRRIRFTPAMKDGVPVSMYIQLEYNFNLF